MTYVDELDDMILIGGTNKSTYVKEVTHLKTESDSEGETQKYSATRSKKVKAKQRSMSYHVAHYSNVSKQIVVAGISNPNRKRTQYLWTRPYRPRERVWGEASRHDTVSYRASCCGASVSASTFYLFGGYSKNVDRKGYFDELVRIDVDEQGARVARVVEIDKDSPRPPARAFAAMAFGKTRLFLYGGWNGRHLLGDTWAFDPSTATWERLCHDSVVGRRMMHTWNAMDGGTTLLLFGGMFIDGNGNKTPVRPGSDASTNEVFAFDTKTYRWKRLETNGTVPIPRWAHAACTRKHKLYVCGGYRKDRSGDERWLNDAHALVPSQTQVTKFSRPSPRAPKKRTRVGVEEDASTKRSRVESTAFVETVIRRMIDASTATVVAAIGAREEERRATELEIHARRTATLEMERHVTELQQQNSVLEERNRQLDRRLSESLARERALRERQMALDVKLDRALSFSSETTASSASGMASLRERIREAERERDQARQGKLDAERIASGLRIELERVRKKHAEWKAGMGEAASRVTELLRRSGDRSPNLPHRPPVP